MRPLLRQGRVRPVPRVTGRVSDDVVGRHRIRRNRNPVLVAVGVLHCVAEDQGATAAALGVVSRRARGFLFAGTDLQRQRRSRTTGNSHGLVETEFDKDGLTTTIDPAPARVRRDPQRGVCRRDAVYRMSRLISHPREIDNRVVARGIADGARERVGRHGYPVRVLVILAHRVTKDQGLPPAGVRDRHVAGFRSDRQRQHRLTGSHQLIERDRDLHHVADAVNPIRTGVGGQSNIDDPRHHGIDAVVAVPGDCRDGPVHGGGCTSGLDPATPEGVRAVADAVVVHVPGDHGIVEAQRIRIAGMGIVGHSARCATDREREGGRARDRDILIEVDVDADHLFRVVVLVRGGAREGDASDLSPQGRRRAEHQRQARPERRARLPRCPARECAPPETLGADRRPLPPSAGVHLRSSRPTPSPIRPFPASATFSRASADASSPARPADANAKAPAIARANPARVASAALCPLQIIVQPPVTPTQRARIFCAKSPRTTSQIDLPPPSPPTDARA